MDQWSHAERQRRKRRAGRFADAGGNGGGAAAKAAERRQRLLALLEDGEDEDVSWDAVAIRVRASARWLARWPLIQQIQPVLRAA
jgi:hypothetical protein